MIGGCFFAWNEKESAMSEQLKAIVQRLYDEFNQGNLASINEMFAPEFHFASPDYGKKDLAGYKQYLSGIRMSYPDARIELHEIWSAEGDRIVTRFTFHGTDKGGSIVLGAPPTNKRVAMSGMQIYGFSGGKVVSLYQMVDALGLMRQLQGEKAKEAGR